MVCVFAVTVVIYGIENGFQGIDTGGLSPTAAGLLGIAPLLLFSFVGFEGQNGAAEEMKDPQKDVPSSIMRSGALAAFCYLVPIFLVLLVLPADAITGIGGFLDAVKESYTIYGGAADVLFGITAILFIFTLMNSGASWMMCGDRVLAVAAADGTFFPYFGAFHQKLGTPLRANMLSGVMATAFMVAAVLLLSGGAADAFGVVLNIAISTTLISYILVFPSVYLLRKRYPNVHRPFRVGKAGSGLLLACVVAHHVLGRARLVDRGVPGDARPAVRPELLVRRELGREPADVRALHDRGARRDRRDLPDRLPRRGGHPCVHGAGRARATRSPSAS